MFEATLESWHPVAIRCWREVSAYLIAEADVATQPSQNADERAIAQLVSVQAHHASA
jgi:hypothetical protein